MAKRGRPATRSAVLDLDGTIVFNPGSTTTTKQKQDVVEFTTKEVALLKQLVQYFHSYYYGKDQVGDFEKLKNVCDSLIKNNNQSITTILKDYNNEYETIWSKLL